jgi:alpha-tubulin suppressor-like RCC1 family protein
MSCEPLRCALSLAILSIAVSSCGSDGGGGPVDPPGQPSVTVGPTTASVVTGATVQLTATVRDANGNVVVTAVAWGTSSSNIAIVSASGLVTGVGPGQATITATSQGKSGSATVVVGAAPAMSALFAGITAGHWFTCALRANGASYCWGEIPGSGGSRPAATSSPDPFVQISGGTLHACAVTTERRVRCWGNNQYRQAGGVSAAVINSPQALSSTLEFASVASGSNSSCALTTAGAAYCWGTGYLGNGPFSEYRNVPVAVGGGLLFTQIAAGGDAMAYGCGIATNGSAWCWGNSMDGALGFSPDSNQARTVPGAVAGNLLFARLATGWHHTCGLTPAGKVYCWGRNASGQLGNGTTINSGLPVEVAAPGIQFASVTVGQHHTCALSTDGLAYCWGANGTSGLGPTGSRLGDGTTTGRTLPTAVVGGLRFSSLAAGGQHTCGLTTSNRAYCWGANTAGQLGDGTSHGKLVPTAVLGDQTISTN